MSYMTLEELRVQDNTIVVGVITTIIVTVIIVTVTVTVIINDLGYFWPL